MTFPSDETLPPDEIPAALAGDHGAEVQFAQMKAWIPQYVAQAMSTVRISAGAGVALSEGLNQTMIYEP